MAHIIARWQCFRRGHHIWDYVGRTDHPTPVRHYTRCSHCGQQFTWIARE